jgi:polyvinyl alcohol dehydrogenase (cytochrome)
MAAGERARSRRTIMCTLSACVLLAGACSGDDDDGEASERAGADSSTDAEVIAGCDWPMWGYSPQRTFAYPSDCETELSTETVSRLRERYFHRTKDVVSATPAVVDGTIYVGDWSGNFYALSLADGRERWVYKADIHPEVYSGQIVSSAAVADVDGEQRVFFAAGKTMYALRTSDGRVRWEHELNPDGARDDPTEIQSSPVVVDGKVIFGYDGHDRPGVRAGLVALDADTGDEVWDFDPDGGKEPSGCAGIWGSPTVDVERALVYAGTANCPGSPERWGDYSEAIFAVDLHTGEPAWHFQPRGPSNFDFDFAGAPNLFDSDGREVVGLGGKDGVYYALDRDTGELIWKVEASIPRVQAENFSTGGFIGATAYADGVVMGGTAIDGPCPCLHGIDVETGELAWQEEDAGATFASSMIVNGVGFAGSTTDFTLRAVDIETGEVLWSHPMIGAVAGGAVTVGNFVVAVAGIREPGLEPAGNNFGVSVFSLVPEDEVIDPPPTTAAPGGTLPPISTAPPEGEDFQDEAEGGTCIGEPCTLNFTLKEPPPGTTPRITLRLTPAPFRIEVRADGLGPPEAWLTPGSEAAEAGAVAYGVFANDDALQGVMLCQLDAAYDCVNETVPDGAVGAYNRISILAITNTTRLPAPTEGLDRIVSTVALDRAVQFE